MNYQYLQDRAAAKKFEQVRVAGHFADLNRMGITRAFKETAWQYLEFVENCTVTDVEFPRRVLHQFRAVVE